ncbi:MAG: hypothetical protein QOJ87_100 [Verrucomicrobiota bacterium]
MVRCRWTLRVKSRVPVICSAGAGEGAALIETLNASLLVDACCESAAGVTHGSKPMPSPAATAKCMVDLRTLATKVNRLGTAVSASREQDERRRTRPRLARSESAEVISKVERTAVPRSLVAWLDDYFCNRSPVLVRSSSGMVGTMSSGVNGTPSRPTDRRK